MNTAIVKMEKALCKLMIDAGVYIPGNLSHRFRDTAVAFWFRSGMSLTQVATLIGDSENVVSKHYQNQDAYEDEILKNVPVRTS